jgi:AAA+ ATPase superfamily predicted ATPase
MFIGRTEELNFLQSEYEKTGGRLVMLYGRRRVGKTETLREFCRDKPHVFYSCKECNDGEQFKDFSACMLRNNMPAVEYAVNFVNWEQAFKYITNLPSAGKKKLLIIDEFSSMVYDNRVIPSILQNLWDSTLKNENIMLVLCGSAMNFIENGILAEKNPLFGRATGILKMKSMDFYEAIQFFPNYDPAEKITAYAVLGGIPHYLKQFDGSAALKENIKQNLLRRGSVLYNEIEFLMKQELRETGIYNMILEAVALGNTKLNDIHQKTQIEKTKLNVYLKNLIELGIAFREFPVLETTKGKANIQRGIYALSDNYFRFWYYFIFPNMSEAEYGDTDRIFEHIVEPRLDLFCSKVFEDICVSYLRKENRAGRLPFFFSKIGRQWKAGFEIDILAHDFEMKEFLFGECKYKNNAFTQAEIYHAEEKFKSINTSGYFYFFSKSGFDKKIKENEYIHLVDINTLTGGE